MLAARKVLGWGGLGRLVPPHGVAARVITNNTGDPTLPFGAGSAADQGPQEEIGRANRAESTAKQVKIMKDIGADRTGFRDPDPDSGVNLAGTVTGTVEEFEANQDSGGGLQGPAKRAAKEEYARSIGYQAPGSQPTSTPQEAPMAEPASHDDRARQSFPETVAQKIKTFVKESASTLSHGVNNAGQPEVQEKLKGP